MSAHEYVHRFVEALRNADEQAARDLVAQLRAEGWMPEAIYLSLFSPAMTEIGRLWEENQISVADEHLATSLTERLISELSPLFGRSVLASQQIILGCVQGENHTLGLRMLSDMLRDQGWRVLYLGADVPTSDWVRLLIRVAAPAVGISFNASRNTSAARGLITAIRMAQPATRILIGGAACDRQPELWRELGADVYNPDPHAAVATLTHLVMASSAT